jgi:hypothetical protein
MFAKGRRRRTVEIFEVDDTATNVNEHTDRERNIFVSNERRTVIEYR